MSPPSPSAPSLSAPATSAEANILRALSEAGGRSVKVLALMAALYGRVADLEQRDRQTKKASLNKQLYDMETAGLVKPDPAPPRWSVTDAGVALAAMARA